MRFPFAPSAILDSRNGLRIAVTSAVRTYQGESLPHLMWASPQELPVSDSSDDDDDDYEDYARAEAPSSRDTTPEIDGSVTAKPWPRPSLKHPLPSSDTTPTVASAKISALVARVCSSGDRHFRQIHNFVINAVLQEFTTADVHHINSKILNKNYGEILQAQVDGLVRDKYLDLRLDEFMDACAASLVSTTNDRPEHGPTTENPRLYAAYRDIWRLDPQEYRYFQEDDFETERFTDLGYVLDRFFDTGFSMNLHQFRGYYHRAPASTPGLASASAASLAGAAPPRAPFPASSTTSFSSSSWFPPAPRDPVPKSVRFHDTPRIVEIDGNEPALYVHCDATRPRLTNT